MEKRNFLLGQLDNIEFVVIFTKYNDQWVLCWHKRRGSYENPGGHVEAGETAMQAARRELYEETGISAEQIKLYRLMDLTYYLQGFVLEIYVGMLHEDPELREELNPLEWLSLSRDFTDKNLYAGEQNIQHIINVALKYPV